MKFRPRANARHFSGLKKEFERVSEASAEQERASEMQTLARLFFLSEWAGNSACGSKGQYVKIWPRMLTALRSVKLEMLTEELPNDISPFEIQIPVDYHWCGSPVRRFSQYELNSLIVQPVSSGRMEDRIRQISLNSKDWLSCQFIEAMNRTEHSDSFCVAILCCLDEGVCTQCQSFCRDKTIEEELAAIMAPDGFERSKYRELVAVAVAAMFFISDKHELLLPDCERPVVERGRGKKRQRALQQLDEERQRFSGWSLATKSERELPSAIQVGGSDVTYGHESGAKHKFQSETRAHMRLQPCGAGLKQRKLVFIESYTRGKHLPKRDIQGFRIPDKILRST